MFIREFISVVTQKRQFGDLGEKIAEKYLIKKGYLILERNFRVKLGELDIIALKSDNKEIFDKIRKFSQNKEGNGEINRNKEIREQLLNNSVSLVFVEVKSGKLDKFEVSRETFHPEEHIDSRKQRLLIRTAQIYLAYKKLPLDINWQIDVVAVEIDKDRNKVKLRHIENAITY